MNFVSGLSKIERNDYSFLLSFHQALHLDFCDYLIRLSIILHCSYCHATVNAYHPTHYFSLLSIGEQLVRLLHLAGDAVVFTDLITIVF